jgi:N-methylhydantoinase A
MERQQAQGSSDRAAAAISIGVDVGGTFTDVVWIGEGRPLAHMKVPTTRAAPGVAIKNAILRAAATGAFNPTDVVRFGHGTTVATNAVLERKGAKTGLLTTVGFRDVLEIGRSFRTNMYDLFVKTSAPVFLAPGAQRRGITERMGPDGSVLTKLERDDVVRAVTELRADGVQAIAVSFLFSFVNPAHELLARDIIREIAPDLHVSLSHEVDPAFREYERTCITAFDAYVKPVLCRYLEDLESDLKQCGVEAPLQVMQSRGGLTSAAVARERPVRLFLSGPAAGVIGGQAAGQLVGEDDLITFDVGGTSCDIALIQRGTPLVRANGQIDGFSVRVPMVDVNAIGAGGGSIAWLDAGGGLRVGPHSAGAEPGPACYGRGGREATVTDASIVLGYMDPDYFAGGALKLDPSLSYSIIEEKVARPLGLTIEQAALGIHRVLNAQMSEGIRLVSVQRGIDPRGFTLVPLGGGGGLHATALARDLGVSRILVPRYPGVLAACGLLGAPIEHEIANSYAAPLAAAPIGELRERFSALDARCAALMRSEELSQTDYVIRHSADLCYVGQAHALEVPIDLDAVTADGDLDSVYEDFLAIHDRVYGHGERVPARFVNLRSVATAASVATIVPTDYSPVASATLKGRRMVRFDGISEPVETAIHEREALPAGAAIAGPAIVEQSDTTTLIEPGWRAIVAAGGTLMMSASS